MRSHSLRRLIVGLMLASACVLAREVRADAEEAAPVRLKLESPERISVGQPFEVEVDVFAKDATLPMLLTATSEGDPVTVVRGRMTKADADKLAGGALRFRVPLMATSEGTGALLVRIDTFACATRCKAIQATARTLLTVHPN